MQSCYRLRNFSTQDSELSDDEEENKTNPSPLPAEYKNYIKASQELEQKLDNFSYNVQKLGSTLRLCITSRSLRSRLDEVRQYLDNRTAVASTNYTTILTLVNDLSEDLISFTKSIKDFRDYNDQDGNDNLGAFSREIEVLKHNSTYFSCKNHCDNESLRLFIEGKLVGTVTNLSKVKTVLERFQDVGIPCLSEAQKRSTKIQLNTATIATFFAGVTASTLQFSATSNEPNSRIAANSLWFVSLVLSTGSAISALLAMTWRQAVFSSPAHRLPYILQFWIRQGYLLLLTLAVLCFIGGLLCYVFATQPKVTFWLSVGSSALVALGLAGVSVWLGFNRLVYVQFRKNQDKLKDNRIAPPSSHACTKGSSQVACHSNKLVQTNGRSDPTQSRSGTSKELTPTASKTTTEGLSSQQKKYADQLSSPRGGSFLKGQPELGIVKDIQLSPCGMWLVVCRKQSTMLYKYNKEGDIFDDKPHLNVAKTAEKKHAKLARWSSSGKYLLLMMSRGFVVYELDGDNLVCKLSGNSEKPLCLEWRNDNEFIVLFKGGELQKQSFDTQSVRTTQIIEYPGERNGVRSFIPLDENTLLLLARHKVGSASVDYIQVLNITPNPGHRPPPPLPRDSPPASPRDTSPWSLMSQIAAFYQSTLTSRIKGSIISTIPLLSEVDTLSTSTQNPGYVVINYSHLPLQLWKYDSASRKIVMLRTLVNESSVTPLQKFGVANFCGPFNSIIACPDLGNMHLWNRDNGEHLCHVAFRDVQDHESESKDVPKYSCVDIPNKEGLLMRIAYVSSMANSSVRVWNCDGNKPPLAEASVGTS